MDTAATLPPPADERVAALRGFNRFYTRRIGVLHERLLGTGFGLAESRVLWELAHLDAGSPGISAAALARELDLDPGYLSRLLKGMKSRKLLRTQGADADARQQLLSLTAAGRRAFAPLDTRSQAQMGELLAALPEAEQRRLLQSMQTIEALLGERPVDRPPYLLRAHRPGDIGWVIARHGAIYADEYHWDLRFEALVARIAAQFVERFDARREACWIAERPLALGQGENLGCVFLVQARRDDIGEVEPGVAQLRLLLVEPSARGMGVGARLVAECERFARQAGYQRIRLWTQSNLLAARAIYAKAGYQLTGTEPHHSFGQDLVAEVWERALG
ncbi:MarR family transcriptional regulator [Aquincola sp. S2]|uniref:MarR family transcriptional regulator n=1 Tax=Pseudaquabacterium terrae TaxID=2732868 RepID=A0ABX2EFY3_9BURK|nr:helix-turn-helix domain-containing GNAT family N-acetyltransferase [Aquabacterium terrae]NRF67547.1 MarR family transcriptional regulator [Aquabacterium terrae]